MSDDLDEALQNVAQLRKQLAALVTAMKVRPAINLVVLDWLVSETEDNAAAKAVSDGYDALQKKYAALKVTPENETAAQIWHGSKGAKLRIRIAKGADYVRTIAAQAKEVAENEEVAKVLKAIEDLKIQVPAAAATKAAKEEGLAAKIRKWAREEGIEVADKGRIDISVQGKYALAHPAEFQK
jgi:hypothetical protein